MQWRKKGKIEMKRKRRKQEVYRKNDRNKVTETEKDTVKEGKT